MRSLSPDATNGDSKVKNCGHRTGSKWLSSEEKMERDMTSQPIPPCVSHNSHRDESKKSLSFFPDDSSGGSEEQDCERTKNSNDVTKSVVLETDPSEHQKTMLGHKVAVPIESDHEESSSTSSCSCEEHSSVAGHSDDDPHGDLDYDDDSLNNSPATREGPTDSMMAEISEPSKQDVAINSENSNGKALENNVLDSTNGKLEQSDSLSSQQNTKIRSFISLDRAADDSEKPTDGQMKKQLKDRSHKSYESLLKYFFKDACFFQMKSINHENVELSKSMGVWSTPLANEVRLNTAFREHKNVILIFSVQQSGAFQGFARMTSESRRPSEPVPWVLPGRLSNATLGGVFQVQWLCTKALDFNETRDLRNPFNDNKPVKVARDGQQVEPKTGKKLCLLFPKHSKERLSRCVATMKSQTKQRKQSLRARNGYYPLDDSRTHGGDFAHSQRHMNGMNFVVPDRYNSMVGPSSSHEPMYPYPRDPDGIHGPVPIRRRGELIDNPRQRRRLHPNFEVHPFMGAVHYDHSMFDYGMPPQRPMTRYSEIPHNGYYPDQYNPNFQSYPGPPMQPMMGPQHSRPYQEYNVSPARYHPYQRARR